MVILNHAQLDHSIYKAVRLETGGIRRCGYFAWIENVNVVCWFTSILSSFASLNLQKTINFNCIYLERNFLGLVQLCIKASSIVRNKFSGVHKGRHEWKKRIAGWSYKRKNNNLQVETEYMELLKRRTTCNSFQVETNITVLVKRSASASNQSERAGKPTSFQCRPTVCDAGPTLKERWLNISCLPGYSCGKANIRIILVTLQLSINRGSHFHGDIQPCKQKGSNS